LHTKFEVGKEWLPALNGLLTKHLNSEKSFPFPVIPSLPSRRQRLSNPNKQMSALLRVELNDGAVQMYIIVGFSKKWEVLFLELDNGEWFHLERCPQSQDGEAHA
jgi:hypothetical protein